ncbi:MAG: peptide chain release factor N(5)-glutamine methyltransferase [Deltaproteobacteria bacterium]|nr:peptide chain release factor N(5)-glutamine methyltransferase [Deltaproteobacteria bacterium]MBW2302483.1 peptide chain release factor N(5)-glutamine methyltransferase [Deltaproteobacteria bacterium]
MNEKTWTIQELLKVASDFLQKKGIESPRLSAEILLAHQLGMNRVEVYLNFDRPLDPSEISGYRSLVKRRLEREPIQYITGVQEFWSLDFLVEPGVLIPRPESELLVDKLHSLHSEGRVPGSPSPRLLDLGTGSGALAVALAREIPGAFLVASDVSLKALRVAGKNAKRHAVENRIHFVGGDLFRPFKVGLSTFDAIVSNPPYIPHETFDSLPPEVRDHEPRLALDGGEGGMMYIRKIINEAPDYLSPGGWLLVEMDPEQTREALRMIEEDPRYEEVMRTTDYSHRFRVVWASRRREDP